MIDASSDNENGPIGRSRITPRWEQVEITLRCVQLEGVFGITLIKEIQSDEGPG
jgi:hypothetical protein